MYTHGLKTSRLPEEGKPRIVKTLDTKVRQKRDKWREKKKNDKMTLFNHLQMLEKRQQHLQTFKQQLSIL